MYICLYAKVMVQELREQVERSGRVDVQYTYTYICVYKFRISTRIIK